MTKVSLKELKETAAPFRTRTEFRDVHPRWYKQAWRRGTLDEICAHMDDARVKWTRTIIAEEALKYCTRSEFSKGSPRAYQVARSRGWLDHLCQHMDLWEV